MENCARGTDVLHVHRFCIENVVRYVQCVPLVTTYRVAESQAEVLLVVEHFVTEFVQLLFPSQRHSTVSRRHYCILVAVDDTVLCQIGAGHDRHPNGVKLVTDRKVML
jgi:hypothetical protein